MSGLAAAAVDIIAMIVKRTLAPLPEVIVWNEMFVYHPCLGPLALLIHIFFVLYLRVYWFLIWIFLRLISRHTLVKRLWVLCALCFLAAMLQWCRWAHLGRRCKGLSPFGNSLISSSSHTQTHTCTHFLSLSLSHYFSFYLPLLFSATLIFRPSSHP